jgi:ribonuclease P protein component
MLTKSQRFHGHNSLRPVYNKGKSSYSRSMKLLWSPSNRDASRAAIVVSKKVHKSAVVRNRIRRRLYAQLRTLFKEAHQPADVIVVVSDAWLALMPKQQLQQEIASLTKAALGDHTKNSK